MEISCLGVKHVITLTFEKRNEYLSDKLDNLEVNIQLASEFSDTMPAIIKKCR